QANFTIPVPQPEYLRAQAYKQLRWMVASSGDRSITPPDELGVFHGYFHYELRHDSQGHSVPFALGLKPPVSGMELEYDTTQEMAGTVPQTGENLRAPNPDDLQGTLEDAYLAQRIFRGEYGRYARSWSELSHIASFKFSDRASVEGGEVPFGDQTAVVDIQESQNRGPAGKGEEEPKPLVPLVIEPIQGQGLSSTGNF